MVALIAAATVGGAFIVALIVAVIIAVIVVFVLRAIGVPEPLPWLAGLLVLLLILLA